MLPNKRVSDKDLQRIVNQRLARTGLATQTPITATVHNGTVILSGTIQFDYQRKPALKAIQSIDGVRNIVDQLKLRPPTAKWHEAHGPTRPGDKGHSGAGQQ